MQKRVREVLKAVVRAVDTHRSGMFLGIATPMQPEDQTLKQLGILAVDDEESNLLLLRRILEREGYVNVVTTTEPSRGPEMFLKTRPSLVLLDLHMPGMDGFELMERLGAMIGGRAFFSSKAALSNRVASSSAQPAGGPEPAGSAVRAEREPRDGGGRAHLRSRAGATRGTRPPSDRGRVP